jgi:hypothetical protein
VSLGGTGDDAYYLHVPSCRLVVCCLFLVPLLCFPSFFGIFLIANEVERSLL